MDTTHLDATAGAQLAMFAALKLLLLNIKSPENATLLEVTLEELRANLLASPSSDDKVRAFNEVGESLLQLMKA